jgi:serralysin
MVNVVVNQAHSSKIVGSIVAKYRWGDSVINYGFNVQYIDKNGKNDFDEGNWRNFYKDIFENVATFTNLTFKETPFSQATLGQILQPGGGGQSSNPYPEVPDGNTYTTVGIHGTVAEASKVVFAGQFSNVWYHEIGHSLGLGHPFEHPGFIDGVKGEEDLGTNYINSSTYTVMSYSPFAWGEDNPWTRASDAGKTILSASVGSYMPLDVAALQHMYGAKAYNTGDNVYTFGDDLATNRGYNTIWDTDGTDTISYAGQSRAKIDLRAATLDDEIGGGGFLSTSEKLTGGFLIASGVSIENARGGAKNDIIHGQGLNNLLVGNAGNDTLYGYGGDDRLDGGTGSDRLDGGTGVDQALFAGPSTGYTVVYDASTADGAFRIKHVASGAIDTLTSIESLSFSDTVLDSHGLFANLQSRFGTIASGSRAKFELALSPSVDDAPAPDVRDVDGAFTASVKVVFDDVAGGWWQRVFDLGNGAGQDNIFLGQVGRSNDMQFTVMNGGAGFSIVAKGAIEQGREAAWTADVDVTGWMRLFKDGELRAEGQGVVPRDVDRANEFVGKSNWSADTPLIGKVSDLTITPHNVIPEIDGAFTAFATARFDDLSAGNYQRIFDTGNGQDRDNIWLGQVGNGDDMAFEILNGAGRHRIVAADTIVEGQAAKWQASVGDGGWMRLFKDDLLVAEGQGARPDDVARGIDLVGQSNWSWDTPLVGRIDDLFFV